MVSLRTLSLVLSATAAAAATEETVVVGANGETVEEAAVMDNVATSEEWETNSTETTGPGSLFGTVQAMSKDEVTEDTHDFDESAVEALLEATHTYMTQVVAVDESYDAVREYCFNHDALCSIWATQGECEINAEFMMDECAPACQACDQIVLEPGTTFGVAQVVSAENVEKIYQKLFDEAAIWKHLDATTEYMESIANDPEIDLEACYNHDEKCTFWATLGECVKNFDFMGYECAPACQSCHQLTEAYGPGPGSDYGVVQIMDPSTVGEAGTVTTAAVEETLAQVNAYMAAHELSETLGEWCYNSYPLCTLWATQGKCQGSNETAFMLSECTAACQACGEGPGAMYGEVQIIDPASMDRALLEKAATYEDEVVDLDALASVEKFDILEQLEATTAYMEPFLVKDDYEYIRTACRNYWPLCTVWAVQGECETEADFMNYDCGPACKACHTMVIPDDSLEGDDDEEEEEEDEEYEEEEEEYEEETSEDGEEDEDEDEEEILEDGEEETTEIEEEEQQE